MPPLIKSFLTYSAGDIATKAIPFFILPIIISHLTPSEFGYLTNFMVITQVLTAICGLNTYTALTVSYSAIPKIELPRKISNLIYTNLIACTFALLTIPIIKNSISTTLMVPTHWMYAALGIACTTAIVGLHLSLLRIENRAIEFNIIQISQSTISAICALLLVTQFNMGWEGRGFSLLIAPTIIATIALTNLKKRKLIFLPIDKELIGANLKFGAPLIPHTLSFWLKSGMDKLIITSAVGISENGIYALALTISSAVGIFTASFFNAFTPKFYDYLNRIDSSKPEDARPLRERLVKITYMYTAILLIVTCLAGISLQFIVKTAFPPGYQGVLKYLPITLVTIFFDGMYTIMSAYIFQRKKTKQLGLITFSSSIIQIVATYILVHNIGAIGAAISAASVSAVTFVIVSLLANKLHRQPWLYGLIKKT